MKRKIDKYFTENYSELLELAKRNVDFYKRSYDPSDVISHAYEYCIEKEISENIDSVVYRVIITSCYWTNSKLNRDMLLKQSPFEGCEDIEPQPKDELLCEIYDKVLLEKWYSDKKALLALYRRKIKTEKHKQIVLDKMLETKSRNHRDLAKHYGVTDSYMYLLVREIQDELQDLEREINNYDSKNNLYR